MDQLITAISTVGFPIVMCVGICYYIYQDKKAEREENKAREEKMFEMMGKFSQAIEKLNVTLQGVDERLINVEEKLEITK